MAKSMRYQKSLDRSMMNICRRCGNPFTGNGTDCGLCTDAHDTLPRHTTTAYAESDTFRQMAEHDHRMLLDEPALFEYIVPECEICGFALGGPMCAMRHDANDDYEYEERAHTA